MARCDVCGNIYEKSFEVVMGGTRYVFDSFECAIHLLAPQCTHCGCRVIGHGVEELGRVFCCSSCLRHHGNNDETDRELLDSTMDA